jgi:hypothetical protein
VGSDELFMYQYVDAVDSLSVLDCAKHAIKFIVSIFCAYILYEELSLAIQMFSFPIKKAKKNLIREAFTNIHFSNSHKIEGRGVFHSPNTV